MKTTEDKISTFDTPQYKRVMAACKERDKFPTQAWIPDEEENPEDDAGIWWRQGSYPYLRWLSLWGERCIIGTLDTPFYLRPGKFRLNADQFTGYSAKTLKNFLLFITLFRGNYYEC